MRPLLVLLTLLLTLGLLMPVAASPAAQTTDCNSVTQIPGAECQALITLFNSTNGPGWTNHTDWTMTNTPCSWYGVTCSGGHVIHLLLTSNQLSGNIPPELGDLTSLQIFLASNNALSGRIPSELGTLTKLWRFELYNNQLSGSIPVEVGNLTSLQTLNLADNQLNGNIPPELGQLTNLRSLNLNVNQLSGSIPSELGSLSNLQTLGLYSNQLSGSLPSEIGNLTGLQYVDLAYNQLSGSIPPELGQLTSLQLLRLHTNQLSGGIPPEFGQLTNLQTLTLSTNRLSGSLPPQLGNLAKLQLLALFNNQLSGSIPPEIGNLTSLQNFTLHNNQLSGLIPASLVNLTGLTNFNLSYNMLSATDADLLTFLAAKQLPWANTQTIPPDLVQFVAFVSPTAVTLRWTPIRYQANGGYYTISYATSPGGPYTFIGQTANKSASSYTATGLNLAYNTTYYFAVQSYTPAHDTQLNNLTSDYSQAVAITTSAADAIPQRWYYTTETPTLTWNAVSWAAGYEIQVATDKTFSAVVFTKNDLTAGELSIAADLPGAGVYYWRVRAIRSDQTPGAWSVVDSFVVKVTP